MGGRETWLEGFFFSFSNRRDYSRGGSFRSPRREAHTLPGCVEGRCTNGYRSRRAVAIPLGSRRSTVVTTTTITSNGLDPRRNNSGSKGWGGRCSVTMETRRAVRHPFPRCIQPWGCDPRSKMQRYFDNGNYPHQGHVPAPVSP